MKTNTIRICSLLLAIVMSVSIIGITVQATDSHDTTPLVSTYDKLDTNVLTDLGQDPEEISVSSKAEFFTKEWYEYITYSDKAVASYKLDERERIVFYDPLDYASSMIMDITYDDSIGWSTANSVSISHEFSKTLSSDTSYSTESSSSTEVAQGPDVTGEISSSVGKTVSKSTHEDYSISAEVSASTSVETSLETSLETNAVTTAGVSLEETLSVGVDGTGASIGSTQSAETSIGVTTGISTGVSTNISANVGTTTTTGGGSETAIDDEFSESATLGWSTVSDRITTSTGSSNSTSKGWSNTESTSIARTFEALYFTDSGVPYSWTIAYYEVKMPMMAKLQYKIGGKWVTVDTGFVLLTTIKGSCRAWNVNGVIHFEHWATSEPVVDTDFWDGFMTKDALIDAYNRDGINDKMFPD